MQDGGLLSIKPVIYVNDDGVYATLVKARGFAKALSAIDMDALRPELCDHPYIDWVEARI